MNIKLLTFSEALEKLKKGEIKMLVRSKNLSADFQQHTILAYECAKFIYLKKDGLWQAKRNQTNDGLIHSTSLNIQSEDLLAEDYIDTSNWIIARTKTEYEVLLEKDTRKFY